MAKNQKRESIFRQTHYFRSSGAVKKAKSAMLVNTAVLNYDLAQCYKRYLQRLYEISPVSYKAQSQSIRNKMFRLYKNAQTFANADSDDK